RPPISPLSLHAALPILLAIGIVAILGGGMANVIVAVAVFSVPTFARLVRGNTLALKHLTFIEAARSIGASDWTIIARHIFPGTIDRKSTRLNSSHDQIS